MHRSEALRGPSFEPASLFAHRQEPIQQEGLLLAVYQTPAKFGQYGEIKPWILQF